MKENISNGKAAIHGKRAAFISAFMANYNRRYSYDRKKVYSGF
jgi:hypothetical protein